VCAAPQLDALAAREIDQEQIGAVVLGQVSKCDVLPVAAIVGEAERALVDNLDEAFRPAAMLDVRRAIGRRGAEKRGVLLGDKAASSSVTRSGNPDSVFFSYAPAEPRSA
jgi:hypothetical protein